MRTLALSSSLASRVGSVPFGSVPYRRSQCKYGVNAFEPPYGSANHVIGINDMLALGVQGCRFGLTWSNSERTPGKKNMTEWDSLIPKLNDAGILATAALETTPAWANEGLPAGNAVPPFNTPAFDRWVSRQADWVEYVVTRYGTKCRYEDWNEQSSASGFWKENNDPSATPHIAAWVQLYHARRAAAKSVDSTIDYSMGGLTALTFWSGRGATPGLDYLTQLIDTFDIQTDSWNIHAYTSGAKSKDPDAPKGWHANSIRDVEAVQNLLVSKGRGNDKVRVGEFGFYGVKESGGTQRQSQWVYDGFKYLQSRSIDALGPGRAGLTDVFYFSLYNYSNGKRDTSDHGFYSGTLVDGAHVLLPAGVAFKRFMAALP